MEFEKLISNKIREFSYEKYFQLNQNLFSSKSMILTRIIALRIKRIISNIHHDEICHRDQGIFKLIT